MQLMCRDTGEDAREQAIFGPDAVPFPDDFLCQHVV